jgi:hypothetical protein
MWVARASRRPSTRPPALRPRSGESHVAPQPGISHVLMSMLQWAAVATASVALFASVLLLAEAGRGLAFEDATAPNSTAGPNIAPHSTSPGTTPTSVETKGGGTDWGAVAAIAGVVAALATTATVIVMRRQGRHAEEKARLELRAVDPVARLELRDDLSQWQEMLRAALGSLFADLSAMSELRSDVIDSGHPVKPRSDLFPSAPARKPLRRVAGRPQKPRSAGGASQR